MPILKDFRQIKEISLPSYQDSKIIIYSGLLFGDAINLEIGDEIKYTLKILPKLIKEWNFVDEENQPIPIDENSLKLFGMKDIEFLITEIQNFVAAQKKT
ncbi:MAG: hypothetical protein UV20_C0009G0016 [Candidatus Magasanikbacteria bacterium GW2011_GWA2_42_32]|uniref:Uncharacterized protein n=1 Tax=Candidatus Magasanikbacteria bacterium GW2011_GWA2_42_32 TaxID=1619039 RepID=A0A0G1A631_9BACT|nr:MAG: hypothetical protein UV20_C0009G0016 [Candidatus Magasanikbacteria bacterium GW2011_GWA2_42_32]HBX15910.1 hypothetical protein [Candidatus Magasanikbacteria bacterium]